MSHIIVSHNADLDGHCSAAVVRHALRSQGLPAQSIRYVGVNYGENYAWLDNLQPSDTLYISDFCFEPFHLMWKLKTRVKSLTWIDHHQSALQSAFDQGFEVPGLRRNGTAACALAWEFFFGTPPPPVVRLLAQHDVFDHTDPRTLPLQMFMEAQPWTSPLHPGHETHWQRAFDMSEGAVDEWVEVGKIILAHRTQTSAHSAAKAKVLEFEGLRFLALNSANKGSHQLDAAFDRSVHDAMMVYSLSPGSPVMVSISLYGGLDNPNDLSLIATKYGGGGHKGACGFQLPLKDFIPILGTLEIPSPFPPETASDLP